MVPSEFSHLPAEAATKMTFVRRYETKSGFNCGWKRWSVHQHLLEKELCPLSSVNVVIGEDFLRAAKDCAVQAYRTRHEIRTPSSACVQLHFLSRHKANKYGQVKFGCVVCKCGFDSQRLRPWCKSRKLCRKTKVRCGKRWVTAHLRCL